MAQCSASGAQLWGPLDTQPESQPRAGGGGQHCGEQSHSRTCMPCGCSAPLCLPSLSRLPPVTSPDLLARNLALKDASALSGVLRRGPNPSQHSGSNLLAKYAPRFLEAGTLGLANALGLAVLVEARRTDRGSGQGRMSQRRKQQWSLRVGEVSDLVLSIETSLKRACCNLLDG